MFLYGDVSQSLMDAPLFTYDSCYIISTTSPKTVDASMTHNHGDGDGGGL